MSKSAVLSEAKDPAKDIPSEQKMNNLHTINRYTCANKSTQIDSE